MKRLRAVVFSTIGITFSVFFGGQPACAQLPLYYHNYPPGGLYLNSVTILPVYWGDWSSAAIKTQQDYLTNLAAYISGENAPAGQEPVIAQYGVAHAKVAAYVTANTPTSASYVPPSKYVSKCPFPAGSKAVPGTFYSCDGPNALTGLQAAGQISFGPNTLIMLFLGGGFSLDSDCCGASYHGNLSTSQFFAVVARHPQTTAYPPGVRFQAVISHELFEGATDPAVDSTAFWGWLTKPDPLDMGTSHEAADQCSSVVSLSWPGAPGSTLQFAQITDNTQAGACSTTGYIPIPFGFPTPLWPGTIVRVSVVAGPVTPLPGTPVEGVLGFVDLNGNLIGQSVTVPLIAGQVASLDLNANLLVGANSAQGQHVDVRPVVSLTGAFLPPLRVTTEVFDSVTGSGNMLASAPVVPGQALGAQGLAGGQTMRITAVAYPPDRCVASLSFADHNGISIGPTLQVNLAPNQGMSLDLNANSLGLQNGQRIELQPMVTLGNSPAAAVSAVSACAAASEVFDNVTGRTWTYQTAVAKTPAASVANTIK